MTLELIYHDEHLVAINKPTGLLVHRSDIDRRETRFAVQQLRDQIGAKVFPVHRLDKPTAGVLLFALNAEIARVLSNSFASRQVSKQYVALVRGHTSLEGTINHALREELDNMTDKLANQDKEAQSAITQYDTTDTCELPYAVGRYNTARYSLVKLRPITGRKHQLRRHMKHISHHIIGDTSHGDGRHNHFFRQKFNCHRLLLAAVQLNLTHPLTESPLELKANLDTQFSEIIAQLGMNQPIL